MTNILSYRNKWKHNGIYYDLSVPQIEIMIWFNLCQKWTNSKFNLCTQLFGVNWDKLQQLRKFQNELKTIDPQLSHYLFVPKKSIRTNLLKNFLGPKVYTKPVITVIISNGGKFGSAFHACLALISKLSKGNFFQL